jgi:hypothetical protein
VVQILVAAVYSHFERAKSTSTQRCCKWLEVSHHKLQGTIEVQTVQGTIEVQTVQGAISKRDLSTDALTVISLTKQMFDNTTSF